MESFFTNLYRWINYILDKKWYCTHISIYIWDNRISLYQFLRVLPFLLNHALNQVLVSIVRLHTTDLLQHKRKLDRDWEGGEKRREFPRGIYLICILLINVIKGVAVEKLSDASFVNEIPGHDQRKPSESISYLQKKLRNNNGLSRVYIWS